MSKITRTGRFLSVAALAASTAMSGPLAAYAQESAPVRLAQAPEELIAPPAAEPPAGEPESSVPPAEDTQPAPDAPEGDPAEIPVDEGTASDVPVEEPAPEEPAAEEPAAEEPAPAPEPAVEEPAAEEPAPEEPAAEEPAAEEPAAEEPVVEEPAVEEPAAEEPAAEEPAAEEPAAEEPAPEEPAAEEPAAEEPVVEEPAAEEPAAETLEAPEAETTEEPAAETPEAPAEDPAAATPEAPAAETPVDPAPEAPAAATPEAPAAEPAAPPVEGAPPAAVEGAPAGTPAPEGATAPVEGEASTEAAPAVRTLAAPEAPLEAPQAVSEEIQLRAVEPGGLAASDAQVQNIDNSVTINSVTNIQGNRIEVEPERVLPPEIEVIERVGDRDILTYAGAALAGAAAGAAATYFIRSNDNERLRNNSQEFYIEELPRGQYRETIVRETGVQVVTIYNDYGDVVQRSRILPDGREVVLFYDPALEDASEPIYYYDVGATLPPLELAIPEDRYIVDIAEPDQELYYETIVAPPVETVERIYSIDEVRRSERIRDKVRRIDLNTITFAFGSSQIEQAEVANLEALANAIAQVIEENPDETFLLEGHTDAVGSNAANLALSDERAESVAVALTDYFDIPAENLVTQGYGEENLKVDTEGENRENRRVTLRRITALVKPVVTSQAN